MKQALKMTAMALLVAAVGFTGCKRQQEDNEQAIQNLLNASGYTDENQSRSYGVDDSTPEPGGDPGPGMDGYERIPLVRFRRFVPHSGVSRNINFQIPAYPGCPDTTALATVTTDIHGELRTAFDTTTNPIQVWRKPFYDIAVRKVLLGKDRDGWHIRKVSPLKVTTRNAPYDLRLTRVFAVGALSHDTFELTTTDTLLSKDQLPWFTPGDTVTVSVEVASTGDSCWAFLHHGRPPRPWRQAYFRTSTWTFERTWVIGDSGTRIVRPSVHDAIGWGSLWADTSMPYVAAAWAVPYIVRNSGEPVPDDQ